MATTLAALGRITISYQVDTVFTHKLRAYVRNPQLVGSAWLINSRTTDANDTPWETAANGLAETLSYLLGTGATFGAALLETRSGSVWQPRSTVAITATNHASGTLWPASQFTLVLRDNVFRKVKVVVLDANYGSLAHSTDPLAGPAVSDNFNTQFTASASVTGNPYAWMVGRGNAFLAVSPIVSWTSATNRKMRRARGLV